MKILKKGLCLLLILSMTVSASMLTGCDLLGIPKEITTKATTTEEVTPPNQPETPAVVVTPGRTDNDDLTVDGPAPDFSLPVRGTLSVRHDPYTHVFSPTMQDYRVHLGIDINATDDAPVYCAGDGIVTRIWNDRTMGWCIEIIHGGNITTYYKNLSENIPKGIDFGTRVSGGQLIGYVGESAMVEVAQEPHLHFEMAVYGELVDPLNYFSMEELESIGAVETTVTPETPKAPETPETTATEDTTPAVTTPAATTPAVTPPATTPLTTTPHTTPYGTTPHTTPTPEPPTVDPVPDVPLYSTLPLPDDVTVGEVYGEGLHGEIYPIAKHTPTIDGKIDREYGYSRVVNIRDNGEEYAKGRIYYLWDDEALYFFVAIYDSTPPDPDIGIDHNSDCVEMLFSLYNFDYNTDTIKAKQADDPGDAHLRVFRTKDISDCTTLVDNGLKYQGGAHGGFGRWVYDNTDWEDPQLGSNYIIHSDDADGYYFEGFVKWSPEIKDYVAKHGTIIGLGIQVNDDIDRDNNRDIKCYNENGGPNDWSMSGNRATCGKFMLVDKDMYGDAPDTHYSYIKDEGWVFEIEKSATALKVDGELDREAYYNGVYLLSEIRPAVSGSNFKLFMTADDTHIYVFYEFTKMEEIFWDSDYSSRWHLDCANFCLNLAGLKAKGQDVYIMAGVEGGKGIAATHLNDPSLAGVDNWYVKHTEKGYNVEFSIPLDKVTGVDENGDKMISFTALATITTSWEDRTGVPIRVYSVASKATGAEDKNTPSYLVVKDTRYKRPTEPTFESYTKDGGEDNWVYEIDKTDVAIAVDGVIEEEAYFTEGNAIYLVSESRPAASGSRFDVFMTADETHIYVFYEFTKMEEIFWDPDYASRYHFDCVDFCLDLAGLKRVGTEFRIMAGIEGGKDVAATHGSDLTAAGVDNWYVKHTEKGYNVEFSIPLDKVTGVDKNGDKMISFTAMSTITTAWKDRTAAPTRVYTVACKAAGSEAKDSPSYLVVKGTRGDNTIIDFGGDRWLITLDAASDVLADAAAVKAHAEANGTVFDGMHVDGNAEFLNDKNNYKVYVAADPEILYVFFDVNDSNIVAHSATSYWQNDCAEIDIDVTGGSNAAATQLRIWPAAEGTNHYAADDEYGLWHGNGAGLNALTNAFEAGILRYYTVDLKDGGYTVLYAINRSALRDGNTAAMYLCVSLNDVVSGTEDAPVYSRAYVTIDSVAHSAGNAARPFANVFMIVDAPEAPVERPTEITAPTSTTVAGNWIYEIEAGADVTVDGTLDEAYFTGIFLEAERNLPTARAGYEDSESTFDLFIYASETHLYVFYEFIKDNGEIFWDPYYSSKWHFDCADFVINYDGEEENGIEFRIWGFAEGDINTAYSGSTDASHGAASYGVDALYVKHTEVGYNVEFSIPIDKITGTDGQGNRKFSFTALSTITLAIDDGDGRPLRAYACAAKASASATEDKANPSIVVIK